MQATIWKDKKQVGMLHNFAVHSPSQGEHFVKRWSPSKKAKKDVESPSAVPVYANHYNGVDRKDRDTADWTVSLKSSRWYMRIFYWILDSVIHSMFVIAKEVGKADDDHPWNEFCGWDGRKKFQFALGHALIERGIMLDCPNISDLKDKQKRPLYMRKNDFEPCDCNECFFCKNGITRGIAHKPPPGRPRFRVPLAPPSPAVPPVPSKDHPKERVELNKYPLDCVVCKVQMKKKYPQKTTRDLRQERKIKMSRLGCAQCASGKGTVVCEQCWNGYRHDL